MIQMHKDIPIGDHRYQIGRLSAADGSWIANTFLNEYRALRADMGAVEIIDEPRAGRKDNVDADAAHMEMARLLVSRLDRHRMAEVQELCLLRCSRYEGTAGGPEVPMPILAGPGRWGVAELEYDGPTVQEIVTHSIAFNIAPFFPDAGSK